ncbi:Phosphoglycolate phosphatase [uncultured archaeon]|nr:Phosphoglycolate phosphatase [uncultured archaeon]
MRGVDAVLFDLDGVLVDSEAYSLTSTRLLFEELGTPWRDSLFEETFGKRTSENLAIFKGKYGWKPSVPWLVRRKNDIFLDLIRGRLKPLPGVVALLKDLEAARVPLAVVSASPRRRVLGSLDEAGLEGFFATVVSGDDVSCCKPSPAPYRLGLRRLKASAGKSVAIEDTDSGVASATAAGIVCLGVRSPNTFGQTLGGANKVVGSLKGVDAEFLCGLVARRKG